MACSPEMMGIEREPIAGSWAQWEGRGGYHRLRRDSTELNYVSVCCLTFTDAPTSIKSVPYRFDLICADCLNERIHDTLLTRFNLNPEINP